MQLDLEPLPLYAGVTSEDFQSEGSTPWYNEAFRIRAITGAIKSCDKTSNLVSKPDTSHDDTYRGELLQQMGNITWLYILKKQYHTYMVDISKQYWWSVYLYSHWLLLLLPTVEKNPLNSFAVMSFGGGS